MSIRRYVKPACCSIVAASSGCRVGQARMPQSARGGTRRKRGAREGAASYLTAEERNGSAPALGRRNALDTLNVFDLVNLE